MNIDYEDDESGFWQARAVHAMASAWQSQATRPADRELVAFLLESANAQMAREEYAELRDTCGTRDIPWPRWSLAQHLWRRLFGHSELETTLSLQREEAVERAERAELEVFDAVAEASHLSHERDALHADVERLKAEVARLEVALKAAGGTAAA